MSIYVRFWPRLCNKVALSYATICLDKERRADSQKYLSSKRRFIRGKRTSQIALSSSLVPIRLINRFVF